MTIIGGNTLHTWDNLEAVSYLTVCMIIII